MCWNVEFSLGSAVVAWIVCAYLWKRNYSPRDKFYARYLMTYTFTQVVDIVLHTLHAKHPLSGCEARKLQFAELPADRDQVPQFLVSKFAVPVVVLVQHYYQLQYPSPNLVQWRSVMIAAHALPLVGMAYQFACSDIVTAQFPFPHDTIRWGGHSAATWQTLVVAGHVTLDFVLTMPERSVRYAHICTFFSVIATLWYTEGTLALGSKWCTYCLIFSLVYATDPWWGPGPGAPAAAARKSTPRSTRATPRSTPPGRARSRSSPRRSPRLASKAQAAKLA
jgi:hypothetical protein